ncbi:hypothetical protein N7527_012023 [Penicillium freii]|nr:hypothetical protein N7527_012023 [Penicillium freii]
MKRRKRTVDSSERGMASFPEHIRRKILFETKTENFPRQRGCIKRNWDFSSNPENRYQDYKTFEGCEAPSHDMVKQFICWLAKSTLGRLTEGKEPTVSGSVPVGYKLGKGSSVPNITMIKEFMLWYMFTRVL